VFQTTLEEPNQKVPEITTEELQAILTANETGLAADRVPVFDVRTAKEYAIAHIPGTINVYELEVQQIIAQYPDREQRMILYCNGPSCGKSKRTSEELMLAGYSPFKVKRYQLGMPVWRALSQTVQTDMPGVLYIYNGDRTSVWVDARTPAEFKAASVPGAVNVQKGEATVANDDGRLPFTDKGTRIVVFGSTAQQARVVAAEIAKKAYWNSSYFGGTFNDLLLAGLINHRPVVVSRNIILAAGPACTVTIRAADVDNGSYDPDSGDSLTLAAAPAGPLGLGQNPVTLTGIDSHGASASSSAFVTVADQTAPSISQFAVQSRSKADHGMVLVTVAYTATDNCSPLAPQLSVMSGDGAQVVDSHHLLLKRGGGRGSDGDDDEDDDNDAGDGVSLRILATDEAGNESFQTITIDGHRTHR
jgi:rhodanese-related sulfurtransferase